MADAATGSGDLAILFMLPAAQLGARERLSLDTLRFFGGSWPRFLVMPEGLQPAFEHGDFRLLHLPRQHMASRAAYNAMLMTPLLYRQFTGFRQILIYQTDCLLLRDDLGAWAARGYSYCGAPWFTKGAAPRPKAVGNGGFCLRAPADALAVLEEGRLSLARLGANPAALRHFLGAKHAALLWRHARQGLSAADFLRGFDRPEDEFWSFYAPLFHPGWRMPSPVQALDFAMEHQPRRSFALNGYRLPLGAHAWWKSDEAFWREQLEILGFGGMPAMAGEAAHDIRQERLSPVT